MVKRLLVEPTEEYLRKHYSNVQTLSDFLELFSMDVATWEDDFMGDVIHGMYQSSISGAGATNFAAEAGVVNGVARLTSGTADDGRSDFSLGLHFRGDQNCVMACRFQLSAITTVKLEVGFTDVVSGTDAGAVNVLTTPSFTATDCAVWCIDTDLDGNYRGASAANGTAATNVAPGFGPVATTYETLIVALLGNTAATPDLCEAYYLRADADGAITYRSAPQLLACRPTILLTPWVFLQSRAVSASRNCDIDYLRVWQRRTATL